MIRSIKDKPKSNIASFLKRVKSDIKANPEIE